MNKLCAACGKPVYFAERKTSLGKEWHPSCLKCIECGKVLSPGQHAEHKGSPYCYHPCYRALFGPAILGYGSNVSSPANFAKKNQPASHGHNYGDENGFKREIFSYQKNQVIKATKLTSPRTKEVSQKLREMLQKIETFNKFYEGKIHHQMTAEEKDDGSVNVHGPLRIYWGLSRPIQLVHCDDILPPPIAQWRHSLCVRPNQPATDIPDSKWAVPASPRNSSSPSLKHREADDLLLSPASSEDVIRRKKRGVRKFKTVAYRSDEPTKWKRASINGHMFNYDTSVFTPVLGSCTGVTADGTMNTSDVIETLLNKFKVQNNPEEYVLSVVSEDGERLLTDTDRPLLERLRLGPDEAVGKIFIKEQQFKPKAVPSETNIQLPIVETEEEENLPHEVEQLLVLPDAVLRGILVKFHNDEETEVKLIKARYETVRRRMQQRLNDMMKFQTSSTA